jgi:hypothetical protein
MLLSPTLQRMLGSVLRRHGNPKNWPVGIVVCDSKVWCEPLVLLVIHLLTLSVHECAENALESETPSSSSSAMKMDDASEGNEVRAVNKCTSERSTSLFYCAVLAAHFLFGARIRPASSITVESNSRPLVRGAKSKQQ